MDIYAALSRLLLLLVVLYGISVPIVIAFSVVEARRRRQEEKSGRATSSWTEV